MDSLTEKIKGEAIGHNKGIAGDPLPGRRMYVGIYESRLDRRKLDELCQDERGVGNAGVDILQRVSTRTGQIAYYRQYANGYGDGPRNQEFYLIPRPTTVECLYHSMPGSSNGHRDWLCSDGKIRHQTHGEWIEFRDSTAVFAAEYADGGYRYGPAKRRPVPSEAALRVIHPSPRRLVLRRTGFPTLAALKIWVQGCYNMDINPLPKLRRVLPELAVIFKRAPNPAPWPSNRPGLCIITELDENGDLAVDVQVKCRETIH